MGQFSFNNNVGQKIFNIKINGAMSVTDGMNFISQYKKNTGAITPSDYTLEFECEHLQVSTKDSAEKLEECFKMYKQSNFKKIVFKVGSNSILKMQLNRIGKTIGLSNYEFK